MLAAGPEGVRAVIFGTPQAVISVRLVDPTTGTEGTDRNFTLPASWNLLTVYRNGVNASVQTPPNAHVCPG